MADLAYHELYQIDPVAARRLLVKTYQETGSVRATAQSWHTSRQVVRLWVRRYAAEGEEGLRDRSHRPHHSPRQVPADLEAQVLQARQETHYGRQRLAALLHQRGLDLSPHTIRHILARHSLTSRRRKRRILYAAPWAWERETPFTLIQVDVKDIRDQEALGTAHTTHLSRHHLPRYQWTACEGRTRLRFLAYSHRLHRTNGIAFLLLVLLWLRAHGVETPVVFQTDWGQEFGGTNPARIAQLVERFLRPLQGDLKRYPLGRKGYNGRVERSHRTDDEEFYRPLLLTVHSVEEFLALAHRWVYLYNVLRPHYGRGMGGQPPLTVLRHLGYQGPDSLAAMMPILLDPISTDLLMACGPETGNDLLAHYAIWFRQGPSHSTATLARSVSRCVLRTRVCASRASQGGSGVRVPWET